MEGKVINVALREDNAIIARKNKLIPGVLYGKNLNKNISIDKKQINHLLDQYGECIYTNIFDTTIDNQTYKVRIIELQRNPINLKDILHFDLMVIDKDIITIDIPIIVDRSLLPSNYKVSVPNRKIRAKVPIKNMIDKIEFNIDHLSEHKKITTASVGQIMNLENVQFVKKQDIVITKIKK